MPIRPATHADIPAIAAICAAAFHNDELYGDLMHPRRTQYPDDWYAFWLRRTRENYWDWKRKWWVAVTSDPESGKDIVVGVAEWEGMGAVEKEWGIGVWDLRMFDV